MKTTCLLTGATGMVGGFLVSRAVAEGRPLAVLVRDKGAVKAASRILEQVRVLSGDLSLPDLGLSSEDQAWVQENCDHVLHAGAKVTFVAQAQTGDPYRTNIDGTRFILSLCKKLEIEKFSYVSTAYVCGDRVGPVDETELEWNQSFHNDYERSKFAVESLVRQADFLRTRTVFRPSIVMGDSQTGFTPSYHTIYGLIQLAWLAREFPRDRLLAAAGIDPDAAINLVPGDWVAEAIWSAASQPDPFKTYHLTHPRPVSVADVLDAVDSLERPVGSKRLPFTPEDGVALLKPLRGYLRTHPRFTSSAKPEPPRMDGDVLSRLCRFAVDNNFLPVRPKLFLDELLGRFVPAPVAPQLTLEFSDGKTTHFNFEEKLPRASSVGRSDNSVFVREDIFEHVLSGRLSLSGAIENGALVMESDDMDVSVGHLQSLLSHLGGAVH